MKYLVQDIETIPETELASEWTPTEEEIKKGKGDPFPPLWVHKVLNIGMLVLDQDMMVVKDGCAAGGLMKGSSEKQMIEKWDYVASGEMHRKEVQMKAAIPLYLVDFNGRGFDVPVLQYRAFRYGIPLSWYFGKVPDNRGEISNFSKSYRDRYGGRHLDLCELWTNTGAIPRPHLKTLAMLMGLPGKFGFDGSKVYQAWKDKKFEEIDRYCMTDVYQTAFIFMRWRYLGGEVSLEEYEDAAKKLYGWIAKKPEHKEFLDKIDLPRVLMQDA